jgi:hypothetical protein
MNQMLALLAKLDEFIPLVAELGSQAAIGEQRECALDQMRSF